ncbi:hypothetical protein I6I99_05490 [Sphingobacterium multivorum]|nr:hypothetical protein [Sphingobacterium multivorum]QQT32026.1 hypothetical protein I6I99_05490 [Sphingobacterium multivorum]
MVTKSGVLSSGIRGVLLSEYSTYPVLYDSKTLREVNDNSTMIKSMAKRYYQWLQLVEHSNYSKRDILSTEFARFLNRGRVKWWDMMLVSKGVQKEI